MPPAMDRLRGPSHSGPGRGANKKTTWCDGDAQIFHSGWPGRCKVLLGRKRRGLCHKGKPPSRSDYGAVCRCVGGNASGSTLKTIISRLIGNAVTVVLSVSFQMLGGAATLERGAEPHRHSGKTSVLVGRRSCGCHKAGRRGPVLWSSRRKKKSVRFIQALFASRLCRFVVPLG